MHVGLKLRSDWSCYEDTVRRQVKCVARFTCLSAVDSCMEQVEEEYAMGERKMKAPRPPSPTGPYP